MKIMIGDSGTGTDIVSGNNITYWLNDRKGGVKSKGAGIDNYNLKYDPTEIVPKLTMKGLKITKQASPVGKSLARGIYIEGDLNIELVGENIVDISLSVCDSDNFAIEFTDNVTFCGEGELIVKGGTSINCHSAGIRAHKEIISDCYSLRAEGGQTYNISKGSFGILTHYLAINRGNVFALAGQSKSQSTGVFAGECIINSGKLTAQGGFAVNEDKDYKSLYSVGICIGISGFTLNGGEVIAVGKSDGLEKYGLYISGEAELIINGGAITAIGDTTAIGKAPVLNEENTYHVSVGDDIASLLKVTSHEKKIFTENKAVIIEEEHAHNYILTSESHSNPSKSGSRTFICTRCGAVKFQVLDKIKNS